MSASQRLLARPTLLGPARKHWDELRCGTTSSSRLWNAEPCSEITACKGDKRDRSPRLPPADATAAAGPRRQGLLSDHLAVAQRSRRGRVFALRFFGRMPGSGAMGRAEAGVRNVPNKPPFNGQDYRTNASSPRCMWVDLGANRGRLRRSHNNGGHQSSARSCIDRRQAWVHTADTEKAITDRPTTRAHRLSGRFRLWLRLR
jgi:hypothetical protein